MGDNAVEDDVIILSSDDENDTPVKVSRAPPHPKQEPKIVHLLPAKSPILSSPKPVYSMFTVKENGNSSAKKNRPGPKSKTRPGECTLQVHKKEEVEEITLISDSDEEEPQEEKKHLTIKEKVDDEVTPCSSSSLQRVAPLPVLANGNKNGHPTDPPKTNGIVETEIGSDDFCSDASAEIRILLKRLKPRMSKLDFTKLEKKFWKKYHKLSGEPAETHTKLSHIIARTSGEIKMLPVGVPIWGSISNLFEYFDADKLNEEEGPVDEARAEEEAKRRSEQAVRKKIIELEKLLNKISQKILMLDEQEVDFDDEENDHNSAYCMRDRLIAKYVKTYNTLCRITKSSKLTGRPVQKRIQVENITKYPELDKVVETFVNSKGYLFAPDFCDILSKVKEENAKIPLHLDDNLLRKEAEGLHKFVINKIQSRRAQDTPNAFPSSCDHLPDDPALNDPDLEAKLAANKKKGKTIKQVVDEFAAQQLEKDLKPEEVNEEDVDKSPPASDNEDGDDDDEEGDDDASTISDSTIESSIADSNDKPADEEVLYENEDEDDLESQQVEEVEDSDEVAVVEDSDEVAEVEDSEEVAEVEDKGVVAEVEDPLSDTGAEVAPTKAPASDSSVRQINGSAKEIAMDVDECSPAKKLKLSPDVDEGASILPLV